MFHFNLSLLAVIFCIMTILSNNYQGIHEALILCGGKGTRFSSVREDIPKSIAPITGRPFIDFLVDDLVNQGIKRIILATGYMSNLIEEYTHTRNDVEWIISRELVPLGTGGALKLAENELNSDPILILNGDSHIEYEINDLVSQFNKNNADVVMLLSASSLGSDYGNIFIDSELRVKKFIEKPPKIKKQSYVNSGVYLISKTMISKIMPNQYLSLENDLFPYWISMEYNLYSIVTNEQVHDIGTPERYKYYNVSFKKNKNSS